MLGTVLIWLLEAHRALAGMGEGEKILAALFQSVNRTAGFNTVDLGLLSPGTLFLMLLLMFVGGSPGSCAGGVKTTTVGVRLSRWWRACAATSIRRTLQVLAIRNTQTREVQINPDSGVSLKSTDALLILGRNQDLARLKQD